MRDMTTGTSHENERAEHVSELHAAYDALQTGHQQEALKRFQKLAEAGSATAWMNLGWMHQSGSGVQRDLLQAQQCYERAMRAGSVMAEHYLASVHRQKGDLVQALRHYESAARAGCLPSLYWAGTMHLKGEGTPRDAQMAFRYLTEASARGHVFARRDLAIGRMRGVFGNGGIMHGIGEWAHAVMTGLVLARREPNSERLM
jgi:uncharacterized protein